jgi:dephospho-CoA kinase
MLKLKKIAITGGISSGKSQASKFFSELGAYVIDSDQIVHQLLTPETELGKKVIELLGDGIIVNGEIDRQRVAKKVFLNPKLLRSLEKILHPQVYEEIERKYREVSQQKSPPMLFLAEVPLLFESEGERFFDKTIAVIADTETSWERYRNATGYEREDFNRRQARQLSQIEKAERADFVIRNNGSTEDLRIEVTKIYDILCGVKVNKPKGK